MNEEMNIISCKDVINFCSSDKGILALIQTLEVKYSSDQLESLISIYQRIKKEEFLNMKIKLLEEIEKDLANKKSKLEKEAINVTEEQLLAHLQSLFILNMLIGVMNSRKIHFQCKVNHQPRVQISKPGRS